jgi:hypothetical protein
LANPVEPMMCRCSSPLANPAVPMTIGLWFALLGPLLDPLDDYGSRLWFNMFINQPGVRPRSEVFWGNLCLLRTTMSQ